MSVTVNNMSPLTVRVILFNKNNSQTNSLTHLEPGETFSHELTADELLIFRDNHSGRTIQETNPGQQGLVSVTGNEARPMFSNTPVTVQFRNATKRTVDLYQVNDDSSDTKFATLAPGTYLEVETFESHPWRARVPSDFNHHLDLMFYIPNHEPRQTVEIVNTLIGFTNHTKLLCDIFRVEPNGRIRLIRRIPPGYHLDFSNPAHSAWIVRDRTSQAVLHRTGRVFTAQTIDITDKFVHAQQTNIPVEVSFQNRSNLTLDAYSIDEHGQAHLSQSVPPFDHMTVDTMALRPLRFVETYSQQEVDFYIPHRNAPQQDYDFSFQNIGRDQPTTFEVVNETGLEVELYWTLQPLVKTTIRPQGRRRLDAFVDDVFIVRAAHNPTAVLSIFSPTHEPSVIRITPQQLHATTGTEAATIGITNMSPFYVDVLEIDENGDETLRETFPPGQTNPIILDTSENRPWRFRENRSQTILGAIMPVSGHNEYEIKVSSTPVPEISLTSPVKFVNHTPLSIRVAPISEDGEEQGHTLLAPGEQLPVMGFTGGLWIVRDDASHLPLDFVRHKNTQDTIHITTANIKSIDLGQTSQVTFHNTTPLLVDIYDIDETGANTLIHTLNHNEDFQLNSISGHAWRVKARGIEQDIGLFLAGTSDLQPDFSITTDLIRTQERPDGILFPGEVALYSEKNFQGNVWVMQIDFKDFRDIPGFNDTISSVRVGPSTGVRLSQNVAFGDFAGVTIELYMDEPDLSRTALGENQASSIRIRQIAAPQGLAISSRSSLSEDFRLNSQGQLEKFSNYRTILKLPFTTKALDVWATEETTIVVEGRSFLIDAVKPARLKPNKLGYVVINMEADKLHTPALQIRTNAMRQDERYTVHPDAALHHKLVNLAPDALHDNRQKLGIKSQFKEKDLLHVQKAVQNVVKTVQYTYHPVGNSVHHRRQITARNMEHAHWSLDFGNGDLTYKPLNPDEVRTLMAGSRPLDDPTAALGLFDAVGNFFSKAGTIIVHTAENVGHDVVETGEHVVGDVVDTAKNVGRHVAETTDEIGEDLAHGDVPGAAKDLSQGTLSVGKDLTTGVAHVGGDLVDGGRKVMGDVAHGAADLVVITLKTVDDLVPLVLDGAKKVGEFLVDVLDHLGIHVPNFLGWLAEWGEIWDDILHTHDVLADSFNNGLDRLKQWAGDLQAESDDYFKSLADTVSNDVDAALTQMGTFDRIRHTPRHPAFSEGVEKAEWWLSLISQHDPGEQMVMANVTPQIDEQQFDKFFLVVDTIVAQDNGAVEAALMDSMEYLQEAFANDSPDPLLLVSAFLEVAKAAAVAGLQVVSAIFDALLELVAHLIDLFNDMINQQLAIPVVADIYSMMTSGRPLSVLSLTALLVAMPTTIIGKALAGGEAPFQGVGALSLGLTPLDAEVSGWGYTYGVIHLLLGPVAVAADGLTAADAVGLGGFTKKADTIFKGVDLAMGFFTQLCGCPIGYPDLKNLSLFHGNVTVKAPNYFAHLIWDIQWGRWLASVANEIGGKLVKQPASEIKFNNYVTLFGTCYGVAHLGLMIALAVADDNKANIITGLSSADWDLDKSKLLEKLELDPDRFVHEDIAEYKNYRDWVHQGGIWRKNLGNVMDTFPEMAEIGVMPAVIDATEGISILVKAIVDLIGHWTEGVTYLVRTARQGLL